MMTHKVPSIFQVVGFSNSGKTTIITKWVKSLTAAGVQVVTIKHHGHSDPLKKVEDADSTKHQKAGAIGSLIASQMEIQLNLNGAGELSLDQLIEFYKFISPDVIIVEGFKSEGYPKVLLLRGRDEDYKLLDHCNQVEGVICWKKEDVDKVKERFTNVFHIEEEKQYMNWLMSWFVKKEES
ncbi:MULTISPECIES: molybdopterin-guanine dinucleotide biosynthesis protein B [Bacillaceae]|uniref:Molybdopterin-guanine dinucleotide biosynthesis protein B n=1 Tax=Evansella alkalicola TaxID=745819 RepID=A0ABS6JTB6_9BACI|nr:MULTISPECIES: molybdopterin-guanine dinucleotide biosynthesis protein B [Bacillaceae]MBU9721823.1 molybdopterin-guanine dinucleotide biosynthesis protein B [Bacillus alkalicola]